MTTLLNNSTRGCDLTHENLIPETEITRTASSDFDATSMSISADVENVTEADSNVTDSKNVSLVSSNDTGMSISDSKDTNNVSSKKKETSNNNASCSIRTDRKFIHEIKNILENSLQIPFKDSRIIQLAVRRAVELFPEPYGIRSNQKIITEAKNLQDKKDDIVTFRIPYNLKDKIKNIYHTNNFTFAINCCLITFKHHILASKSLLQCTKNSLLLSNEYLFSRFGLKKGRLLKMITNSIEEMRSTFKCTSYIEPFTGTANVFLHLTNEFDYEEINDGEKEIINLLQVIQNCVNDFILELLCYPVKEETFDKLKKELKNADDNFDNSDINDKTNNAVKLFYTILLSYYGKGGTFRKNATEETILKKLIILHEISKRLKDTKISKNDIYFFLDKILVREKEELKKTIIYFDPPYIGTEQNYKVSKKEIKKKILNGCFHKKLNKKILHLKKNGANLAISYRATVTCKNKYKMTNKDVQKILDELYMDKGFFIQPKRIKHYTKIKNEYVPDDQIEILLTSVQVDGSFPYDRNIADLIKNI